MQLQIVETDTGHSPFSSIGRGLEDKVLDIIAAVKQQQERTWHPRMMADVQLPERFGEPYAAVINLQKQGPVEQIRLSGLQVGSAHLLPEIAGVPALHEAMVMPRMHIRLQPQAALLTNCHHGLRSTCASAGRHKMTRAEAG